MARSKHGESEFYPGRNDRYSRASGRGRRPEEQQDWTTPTQTDWCEACGYPKAEVRPFGCARPHTQAEAGDQSLDGLHSDEAP